MKLSEIKPNPNNPRLIKDDKFKKLVKSLQDFPQMMELRPIIIDENNVIQGGNMRFKALKELGYKELPSEWVKQGKDLTEAQWKEFVIKDNVGFGEWDWDDLANNWDAEQLSDWGLDVPGFEVAPEAEEDDFDVPVGGIETDIVLGDLFEIGRHRLMCGDSTDSDSVARLMKGDKADMLTDPPYGINANKQTLGTGKKQFERGGEWDNQIPEFFYLIPMFGKSIIWGGNYFSDKLPVSNDWLCWDKKNQNLSFSEFELAWSNTGKNCRIMSHHWSGEEKLHPTMKPVSVMAWCLEYLPSENIFDPFIGSGSTMVACHQLNRKCYGMELDPKYCQVIINRMLKLDPTLEIKKNGAIYKPDNMN